MKIKDLGTMTAAALGAAALTVATFLGIPLDTGSDSNLPGPTITQPELVANGIRMSLSPAEGRQFQAGDKPEFELEAVNTLCCPSTVTVCLALSALGPISPLSRALPIPTQLWQESRELALEANETKTFTFSVQTNLPDNRIVSVWLSERGPLNQSPGTASSEAILRPESNSKPGIVALRISTVPPNPAPAIQPKP